MAYRTIEIHWRPRSASNWATYAAARREAARLWSDLVERHHRLRRRHLNWPSRGRWQRWAKRRYPGLSAQSAQQIIGEFREAVNSARQLRKNGQVDARYPWKKPKFHDVVYTNQDARIRNGHLILPNGTSGTLRVRLPKGVDLPGRLMEVRLGRFRIVIVCKVIGAPISAGPTIGVDLGVNTLIAATDGEKAILVSGKGAKATVQWWNKRLASVAARQSRMSKGSKRWKRLQRRKRQLLAKADRRLKDVMHKATRQVAEEFPHATCYVGEPFNDVAQKIGRCQAQQVSQACNRKIIRLLDYKTGGAITVNEAYTSQTCPVCGERSKHRRTYRCRCGTIAPRDVIGSMNVLCNGKHGSLLLGRQVPVTITYLRPRCRSSSGGHPASSSGAIPRS
jgi:putative transposase